MGRPGDPIVTKPALQIAEMGEGLVMLKVSGLFEGEEAASHKNAMIDAIKKTKCQTVWFDLSEIAYIDSAALAVLIAAAKAAADRNLQFCLYQPVDHVLKVLEVTGVDKIIPIV